MGRREKKKKKKGVHRLPKKHRLDNANCKQWLSTKIQNGLDNANSKQMAQY